MTGALQSSMEKVIVVGHPGSPYQQVHHLMQQLGLAQARPSRREGLLPHAISAALCQAYDCTPLRDCDDEGQLRQLEVAPVWHGLALDLLMGNLEQDTPWGWAEPATVHLLNYWHQLDPAIRFVLVYDAPETAFLGALGALEEGDKRSLPQATADQLQRDWCAFNAALLHFHLRHREHSVLLHGGQVEALFLNKASGPQPLREQVVHQLGFSMATDTNLQLQPRHAVPGYAQLHLSGQLVLQYSELLQIHAELEAVADFSAAQSVAATYRHDDVPWPEAGQQAQVAVSELQALKDQALSLQEDNRRLAHENALALRQLHAVQEELEKYFLKSTQLERQYQSGADVTKPLATARTGAQSGIFAAWPSSLSNFAKRAIRRIKARHQAKFLQASGQFDASWYLAQNPDVANIPAFAKQPALHYLLHGAQEGRDPSPDFGTSAYLSRYPDVRISGINPLLHYVRHGRQEGRWP